MEAMIEALKASIDERGADFGPAPDLVEDWYNAARVRARKYYDDWRWYLGEAPIVNRAGETGKPNNRIAHPFPARIVDQKIGYLYGIPQDVYLSKEYYQDDTEREELEARIKRWRRESRMESIDADVGRYAAATGVGFRLLSIEDGEPRVRILRPWEVDCLYLESIRQPEYALRWIVSDTFDGGTRERLVVYSDTWRWIYSRTTGKDKKAEAWTVEREAHAVGRVPVFALENNPALLSDWSRVRSLIEEFDRCTSDLANELEEFRGALLLLKNIRLGGATPEETAKKRAALNRSRTIEADSQTGMGEPAASFAVKDLPDAALEHHKDRLHKHILHGSGAAAFEDEAFSGNLSGVAIRFKIIPLENKSQIAETLHRASDRDLMTAVCRIWGVTGAKIDPYAIESTWTRSLPVNVPELVQTAVTARALVSEETALSMIPAIVGSVRDEVARLEAERGVSVSLGDDDQAALAEAATGLSEG